MIAPLPWVLAGDPWMVGVPVGRCDMQPTAPLILIGLATGDRARILDTHTCRMSLVKLKDLHVDTGDPIVRDALCRLMAEHLEVSGSGAAFTARTREGWLVMRENGIEAPKRWATLPVPAELNCEAQALAAAMGALWGGR